jgi:hypothetical protein
MYNAHPTMLWSDEILEVLTNYLITGYGLLLMMKQNNIVDIATISPHFSICTAKTL